MYVVQTKDGYVANKLFEILINSKFKDESGFNVTNNWFGSLLGDKIKTIHVYPTQKTFRRKIMSLTYLEITDNDFPIPLYDEKFFTYWDFKFVMVEKK